MFTWGQNNLGQIGQCVGQQKEVPTKMEILKGWDVRALACGAHHTVAITPGDLPATAPSSRSCNMLGQNLLVGHTTWWPSPPLSKGSVIQQLSTAQLQLQAHRRQAGLQGL